MVRYEWGACTAEKSKKIILYQTDLWIFLYNMQCKPLINNLGVALTYFSCMFICLCLYDMIVICVFIEFEICQNIFPQSSICWVFSFTKIEIREFVMLWSRNFCNDSYRKIYRSCLSFTCVPFICYI